MSDVKSPISQLLCPWEHLVFYLLELVLTNDKDTNTAFDAIRRHLLSTKFS